ncbi:MAG: DNA polymerase I [Chloroflexi bacterium]|nr:DNA polymerase I [Chloroflexota bacterium]
MVEEMAGLLVLIDGNALLHRAFHAVPLLTTSKGELVNATYGFAQMLLKAWNELKPDYIAAAFDKAGPTFRHKEFEAYKAQRPKAADGLYEQFPRVKQLIEAFNIPAFEVEGFEADDVLGTLAKQATDAGIETIVVTGDTDALQLVGPHVRVMTPGRVFAETTLYDEEAVRRRYGLEPHQLADFKGLKGDPSDNIPGVPGVGDKTATRLLARFGTVENVYAHLEEVDKKLRDVLERNGESARQSKHLATIVTDVPIQLDPDSCRTVAFDRDKVVALLRELEFRSLLGRLPQWPGSGGWAQSSRGQRPGGKGQGPGVGSGQGTIEIDDGTVGSVAAAAGDTGGGLAVQIGMFEGDTSTTLDGGPRPLAAAVIMPRAAEFSAAQDRHYTVVETESGLDELIETMKRAREFTIDLETTHKDAMRARIVGIAVATAPACAWYVPVGHRTEEVDGKSHKQLRAELVLDRIRDLLEDASVAKCAHNAKYEITVLARQGLSPRGFAVDTMIAAYLLEPSQRAFNLKDLAWTKLGVEMTPITTLIGKGKTQISMAQVPIPDAAQYASCDADMTCRLSGLLVLELEKAGLGKLYKDVEMPLVPVLAQMEQHGVALDVGFLHQLSAELHHRIVDLELAIYDLAGHRFNVNSTQQLASVLFGELRLPPSRRTKTGHSTEADVLEELRGAHPVVERVLEYRQLQKLKSTYVDALPLMINSQTGRLHTSFNQTGTVTGRLSSSEPNLQNIPIRTELGRKVRGAFIAPDSDTLLLSADYSQIELRILAHISQDKRLIEAFAADEDVHAATASEIFGVPLGKVTSDMRRVAKVVNFGIIYGMSDYGLAAGAGLSRKDASAYIANYIARYEGVQQYVENTKREAEERGYVTTLLGRRRYLPEIYVNHHALRMAAQRTAINMPIQGTAADIIKIAMVRVSRALGARRSKTKMILQVHDELLFEVPRAELAEINDLVKNIMENALPMCVQLKVETKVGANWNEMN